MSEAVIVALIGAISTVIGVIITNRSMLQQQADKIDKELSVYQTRTDERIAELTREVREHNSVIKRTYVLEEQVKELQRTRPS